VTAVSLVISGLLVGVMIGISCYGAVTLPPDARIPLHYGFGGYNNFRSKNVGLLVWPAAGALVFALLTAVSVQLIRPNHPGGGRAPLIIMPIVLVIIVISQWGAISIARRNTASPQQ
jgi:hypothetical protein